MANIENKTILWEIDRPLDLSLTLSYEAGIWFWVITNTIQSITDDNGQTGYYSYIQEQVYSIKSLSVDNVSYSRVLSLSDLRLTDQAFYYDYSTTRLYIHFTDTEPPLSKEIFYGAAFGYTFQNFSGNYYYNDIYYEPRLLNTSNLKKSIDPLFWGLIAFQKSKISAINNDGHFDDWRDKNLYGQQSRILFGNSGDNYDDLDIIYEGFISDDSRTFEDFTVEIQDLRKKLTQPVAVNLLDSTTYPNIKDTNKNKVKPVAYGSIRGAEAICLNENGSSPYQFMLCDTDFNNISSITTVYIDGANTSYTDNSDGTISITSAQATAAGKSFPSDLSKVTADFVATSFDNGVDIIKDLLKNYNGLEYISSFWNLTEVNAAQSVSRDTSLYIKNGNTKLSKAIEQVAFDIDARVFVNNQGLYTIRIYDENREVDHTIEKDEWLSYPEIENNASEFLSSAIIEFNPDVKSNSYKTYVNDSFSDSVFDTYKQLKTETFKTGLQNETDAQAKSNVILNISSDVQDIITRKVRGYKNNYEPTDFILCDPITRDSQAENKSVYELMSVQRDISKGETVLDLRFVRESTETEFIYTSLLDNNNSPIKDNNNQDIITKEVA